MLVRKEKKKGEKNCIAPAKRDLRPNHPLWRHSGQTKPPSGSPLHYEPIYTSFILFASQAKKIWALFHFFFLFFFFFPDFLSPPYPTISDDFLAKQKPQSGSPLHYEPIHTFLSFFASKSNKIWAFLPFSPVLSPSKTIILLRRLPRKLRSPVDHHRSVHNFSVTQTLPAVTWSDHSFSDYSLFFCFSLLFFKIEWFKFHYFLKNKFWGCASLLNNPLFVYLGPKYCGRGLSLHHDSFFVCFPK